ncbi:MAG: N-acetylmuramoyl-L-alanine amidase [Chloroflexales bacterium]|nr:N-acetylmuramoyl-L-alanine amidase [Chloroflexales bacterium]
MSSDHHSLLRRRSFLKGTLAAGALLGLGLPHRADLLQAAQTAGIRANDWHTAPRNDGQTVDVGPADLAGDLQLLRNADGSFQPQRIFVSAVHQVSGWYNMVGMHWAANLPAGTTIAVEVRSSRDGLTWSAWTPVGHELQREGLDHAAAEETFTDAVELGRARAMQYRITLSTSDSALSPTVRRVTATQIDALDAPTLAELDARGRPIPFALEQTDPPSTRFIPRDGPLGWGPGYISPDSPLYWPPLPGMYPFEFVTIHHTAGANNPEKPLATVRAIWYYHALTLGWGDIGYHFLIDQYGNVYEGRDGGDSTVGGHAYRYNHHNCGISLLGQFHPGATDVPYPAVDPTREALTSATMLAALEAAYHKFDPRHEHLYPKPSDWCRPQLSNYRVSGHRDWGRGESCIRTVCPGENVYKHLPQIRMAAAALVPQVAKSPLMRLFEELG